MRRPALLLSLAILGLGSAAYARVDVTPAGLWNRDDGLGGVRIAACGDAYCGDVTWLKNPRGPGHVGQRVLFDLHKTAAATWSGSAFNPANGGTYAGIVTLAGNHLTMRGCVLGGLLCKSLGMRRAR